MADRSVLVTNPRSGSGEDHDFQRIEDILGSAGDVSTVSPRSVAELDHEVREASAGASLVVVAGGDGTMNATINALADRLGDVTFGLIPMGTGNDLARTLDLSTDPYAAAEDVVAGEQRRIDVGKAEGNGATRLFANACIGGFPIAVDEAVDEDIKKKFGSVAYLVAAARSARQLDRSSVTLDGIVVDDCVATGVGNGRTCGGGVPVWPSAAPDDGILDGCALAAEDLSAALLLAAKVKLGKHESADNVRRSRGRVVRIDAEPEMEMNVDGELVSLRTPVEFSVAKHLMIKVPRHR